MTWYRPSRLLFSILVVATLCVSVDRAGACPSVSPHAHGIVAGAVIDLLPDPVGAYFEAHAARLRGLVADIPERASARHTMRGDTHFVFLDVAARDASAVQRRRAARAFPRNAGKAAKLCQQHGRSECGRLPWGLIETYAGLVVAFRANNESRILADAAAIVHLATDAAMPFNTTTARDGSASNPPVRRGGQGNAQRDGLGSTARRFQHTLIEKHRDRLTFEVRVWSKRLKRGSDPLTLIFETLLDAHLDVEALGRLDRGAAARTDRTDAAPAQTSDKLNDLPATDRALRAIEHHLEAGALLGASLIDAAWVTAGRPVLSRDLARSEVSRRGVTAGGVKSACGEPFCGSRDSTVFHRASCPHVQRIKPENLGGFATLDDARRSGRKGCRQCKPESRNQSGPKR